MIGGMSAAWLAASGAPRARAQSAEPFKIIIAFPSVLEEASVKKALLDIGGLPSPLGQQAFAGFIAAEHARWGKFIKDAGLKPTGTDAGASIGTPR